MSLAELVADAVSARGLLALPLAFLGGVATGLNPCCLPLYPAAAATCCATRVPGGCASVGDSVRGSIRRSSAFIVGVALATTALGVLAAWVGRTLTGLNGWAAAGVGMVPALLGLHFLGIIRIPFPRLTASGGGIAGAFVTGLLLALVLAPCGTPILAAVLSYAALTRNVVSGGVLLFAYGLGTGLPILVVGTLASSIASRLDGSGWRQWVDRATGVALLALGIFVAVR